MKKNIFLVIFFVLAIAGCHHNSSIDNPTNPQRGSNSGETRHTSVGNLPDILLGNWKVESDVYTLFTFHSDGKLERREQQKITNLKYSIKKGDITKRKLIIHVYSENGGGHYKELTFSENNNSLTEKINLSTPDNGFALPRYWVRY